MYIILYIYTYTYTYLAGATERSSMLQRGKRFQNFIFHWDHKNSCPDCDQVKDLSQLKHRFEANTYHDVKLKKLARRIRTFMI